MDFQNVFMIYLVGEQTQIIVLIGPPKLPKEKQTGHHLFFVNPKGIVKKLSQHWWCICQKCGKIGIEIEGGMPYDCQESCFLKDDIDLFGDEIYFPDGHKSKRLKEAYSFVKNYLFP